MKTNWTNSDRPMLVSDGSVEDLKSGNWKPDWFYGCYWQEKLNGVRAHVVGKTLMTRQLKVIKRECLPHIFEELEASNWPQLDGELFAPGKHFQDICGMVTPNRKEASIRCQDIKLMVFDLKNDKMQMDRFEMLSRIGEGLHIKYHTTYGGFPDYEVFEKIKEWGGEGLICRNAGGYYQPGVRSPDVVRFKVRKEMVVRITNWIEGEGKHYGRLGALVVTTKEGEKFKVGTGFSDSQRIMYDYDNVVGKFAELEYEMLSRDGIPLKPSFVKFVE